MAIDTAEKRRSAAGTHLMAAGPGVTPNSAKDIEWRYQAGYAYSGIVLAVVIAAEKPGGLLVFPPFRRRRGPSLEVRRRIAETVGAVWVPYVAEVFETIVSGRPVYAALRITASAPEGIRYADTAAVAYAMALSTNDRESLVLKDRVQPVWNMRQAPVPLRTTVVANPSVETAVALSQESSVDDEVVFGQHHRELIHAYDEILGI